MASPAQPNLSGLVGTWKCFSSFVFHGKNLCKLCILLHNLSICVGYVTKVPFFFFLIKGESWGQRE